MGIYSSRKYTFYFCLIPIPSNCNFNDHPSWGRRRVRLENHLRRFVLPDYSKQNIEARLLDIVQPFLSHSRITYHAKFRKNYRFIDMPEKAARIKYQIENKMYQTFRNMETTVIIKLPQL
jgi:hypothetical protein